MNRHQRQVLSAAGALSFAITATGAVAGPAVAAAGMPVVRIGADNPMPECATPGRMMAYLYARNPGLDQRYAGIAGHYMRLGRELQVRWDYAFFQMIVETGSLTFRRGDGRPGSVSAGQNNFAGLGAAGDGQTGESFPDIATGVKAHLQHLVMYAGERIQSPVAERTRKVQEWGVLTAWHKALRGPVGFADVTRKWATDPSYGASVEAIGRRFYEGYCVKNPASAPVAAAQAPAPQRSEPVTERAEVEARVSGVELARAAIERARTGGDGARTGLGMAPAPDALPMPRVAPSLAEIARDEQDVASAPSAAPRPAAAAVAPREPAARPAPPAVAVAARPSIAIASVTPPVKHVNPADEAIRSLVSGKTFVLDATMGMTIPIAFRDNGSMRGSAGNLASYLGAATDEGRWWVARGRLCQRWNVWLSRETQCLQLRHAGAVIHWVRDDGKTGTARIASR